MMRGVRLKILFGGMNSYKALKDELEETQGDLALVQLKAEGLQSESERLQSENDALQSECQRLSDEVAGAKRTRDAYRAALSAFCPKIDVTSDMKRFYECVAPWLDAEGFKLYFAAKKLTRFESYNAFPYEDARGLFEFADGHQLMRYLIAYHFNAVEWHIVSGTCYEEASLLPVDTATPEYRAFEKKLYTETLRSMGFQTLLPEQPEKSKTEKERG